MKLAIILPTRSKPEMCFTAVNMFMSTASGDNDIRVFIRIDDDEAYAYAPFVSSLLRKYPSLITPIYADAPLVPAQKALEIVESKAFKDFDPDIHILMSDDVFPMTMHWDANIAEGIKQGNHAFCWQEINDPKNQTYIILSKKYVEAMPTYLATWFPFWFTDTWRNEVHLMVFGQPMPIITSLPLGGAKRGKTHGLQDAFFWFDFFKQTRQDRIQEAKILASNLNLAYIHRPNVMAYFDEWDRIQFCRAFSYEYKYGGNPSAKYDEAKMIAENYLREIKINVA